MYLEKRARCYNSVYNYYYECNTGWYVWGRWVLFGILVFGALFLFFLFACLTARRRRRRGLQPYRGTGWASRQPWGQGQNQYNPSYGPQQSQVPQYGASANYYGQNQGQNQGYYGGQQQSGVELQQPPNTYRGGDQVYEPPAGPPPGKA